MSGSAFILPKDPNVVKQLLERKNKVDGENNINYNNKQHRYTDKNRIKYTSVTELIKQIEGGASFDSIKRNCAFATAKSLLNKLAMHQGGTVNSNKAFGFQIKNRVSLFTWNTLRHFNIIDENNSIKKANHPLIFLISLLTEESDTFDQLFCFIFGARIINENIYECCPLPGATDARTYILTDNAQISNNSNITIIKDYDNGTVVIKTPRPTSSLTKCVFDNNSLDSYMSMLRGLDFGRNITDKERDEINKIVPFVYFFWKMAALNGTSIHEDMEIFMNNYAAGVIEGVPEKNMFRFGESIYLKIAIYNFLNGTLKGYEYGKDYEPYRTELMVHNRTCQVAGRLDCILKHKEKDEYIIIDWKRLKNCELEQNTLDAENKLQPWFYMEIENLKYEIYRKINNSYYKNGNKSEMLHDNDVKHLKPFGTRKHDKYFTQIGTYAALFEGMINKPGGVKRYMIFMTRPFGSEETRVTIHSCPGPPDIITADNKLPYGNQQRKWYETQYIVKERVSALLQNNRYLLETPKVTINMNVDDDE
jgi:hypothetical protein